ncbi:MAG TPA: hypothetical protein PKM16_11855 [Bacteroidia bacterium]|nr:hypothetical protein [Bacteroidia bacterium]
MNRQAFLISTCIAISFFISVIALTAEIKPINSEDVTACIVKYDAKWGQDCKQCNNSSKSYTVYFRNECSRILDVKLAVQESDLRWRTYTRLNMRPEEIISGYACAGTGKYLYWVRKSGDNSVSFPGDEEINAQYAEE